jgi:hypothetical protein
VDAGLSRAGIVRKRDPHDWNSYDHYQTIHEKRLAEHPFVDESGPNTVEFVFIKLGGILFLRQRGRVYCKRNVILEVEKEFETRRRGNVLQVRGVRYRYVAWVENDGRVLRYHNLHADPNEYHHRAFDPITDQEILYERLIRVQFPTFSEVLDEIEFLTRKLKLSVTETPRGPKGQDLA